ncbi:MAG: hypothetical protein J6K96_09865 [Treponema sp.]|nr:hypothetical protein [Treponema sp.]
MKKIVKISAVITTAVVLTGCSVGSSTSNDNYYEEPTNPVNPGIDPTEPTNPVNPDQYPAYYIDEELGGQKFVAEDTEWYYEEQAVKNQKFTDAYTMAQKFMRQKVTELQTAVTGQTDNNYYKMIDTVLQKYNSEQNIADNINANYYAFAPLFDKMENVLLSNYTTEDYHAYVASYYKLAHNAYNESLGMGKGSLALQANRDMKDLPENTYVSELAMANLSYNELTVDKAKAIMNKSLNNIAGMTNTDSAVLKKVIELALYNESLYGLNDMVSNDKVNNQSLRYERRADEFKVIINSIAATQSIDDRTM